MADTSSKSKPKPQAPKLAEGVEFTKPTSQLDLEARQEAAKKEPELFYVDVNPAATDENEEGFIGTDPIYYGRANETELPSASEDGPEKVAEEAYVKSFEKPDHEKAAAEKAAAEKAAK